MAALAVLWPLALWTQGLYRHRPVGPSVARSGTSSVPQPASIAADRPQPALPVQGPGRQPARARSLLFPLLAITALVDPPGAPARAHRDAQPGAEHPYSCLIHRGDAQGQAFADMIDGPSRRSDFEVIGHLSDGEAAKLAPDPTDPRAARLYRGGAPRPRSCDEVAICLPPSRLVADRRVSCAYAKTKGKIVRIPMDASSAHARPAGKTRGA